MADNYFGGVKAGATSVSIDILIRSKTDNTALTGLAYNTAGNIASYRRQGAARVAITLATQTVTGAYSSGGMVEIDATNMPGLYRLDVPDAALVAGVDYVTIALVTTNGYVYEERLAISSATLQTGDSYARLGAPAGASHAADIAAVNAKTTNLPPDPADASDIAASFAGVNTKLDTIDDFVDTEIANIQSRLPTALTANGNMKASLVEILTTALTETAGQLAAAFKKFFNVATPAATMDHGVLVDTVTTYTNNTPQTGDNFARLALVKAKTDQLTFTVAGELDINIQSINDVTINGTGVLGDEFQP